MNTKKTIKKTLNEVAGISFEVRKWAQIIETYVKDYINSEREKLKSQKPKVEPKSGSYSWSYDNNDTPEDDYKTEFTYFESHGGEKYDTALIYGQELYINADILDEFPNIENIIRSKLFEVTLDGKGDFTVDTIGSSFPDYYLTAILEIVQDHMTMGMALHNDKYEEVFATYDGESSSNYYSYMNEDNSWSSFGGYSYTPQPKIDKIEINGKDFPEAYEDFKVDKWVITNSNRIEYDHWKSGYDESGEYVVYLNMPMSSIGGSALVHEIKHAYDDWNRMSKGAPPIRAGWEIQNIYTPDFEKLVLGGVGSLNPMFNPIIRYYYLGSKLESPAYLENEYDSASVMGSYRDTAKKMMNFKASNFLDKKGNPAKGLQKSWTDLITKYNIPFFRKFKNVVDFLNYTEKHFNKRGREIMKRIDKMRYVHNKPQPKYEPKVYNTQTQKAKPIQISNDWEKLNSEVDDLEEEWDDKYELYLQSKDPKLRKELDDLDKAISDKIDKLNKMNANNLPF